MWNPFHHIFLGVVDFNSFRGIARIIIGILPRNRSNFPKKVWIYKKIVLFPLQKICHTGYRKQKADEPLRQCSALPPLLIGEALAVGYSLMDTPEAPLLGKTPPAGGGGV
mgnify:FL=1